MNDMKNLFGFLVLAVFSAVGSITIVGWVIDKSEAAIRKAIGLRDRATDISILIEEIVIIRDQNERLLMSLKEMLEIAGKHEGGDHIARAIVIIEEMEKAND